VPPTDWLWRATATRPGRGSNDHLAEFCRDDLCHRLPCRMYKAGYERGFEDGRIRGQAEAEPEVIYIYVQSSG
jgi:hypothetical protein